MMDSILTENPDLEIPRVTKDRWQNITDTVAAIFEVPAAVITQKTENGLIYLVSSQTQNNPFTSGSTALTHPHSYFEIVSQSRKMMIILNAEEDPAWSNHIDANYGMVSFLGYPLFWPSGEVFGSVAVLDSRERNYAQAFRDQLYHISTLINSDLQLIHTMQELEEMAPTDSLTGLRNRNSLETDFEYEASRAVRYAESLSILAININNFRNINEFYGYGAGDVVLIEASDQMKAIKRKVDKLYRVEGDDFILLLPGTSKEYLHTISRRIQKEIASLKFLPEEISISLAISGTEWKQGEPWIVVHKRLNDLIREVKGNSGALPLIT